ncbi:MAG: HAMP domain-containing protein [Deltaproteobacteria bacterium]|nr:HAMP domain-containing protein [Deltaproteobacteria bacterium]
MKRMEETVRSRLVGLFPRRRRGRLVRDYFLISVFLILAGLIASALVELYFRYQESQESIALLQQEVASSAAFKIESFLQEIKAALKTATKSREIAVKGLVPEYKFELERLLLTAPAITELVAVDAEGVTRVKASRLRSALTHVGRSSEISESFRRAMQGGSHFGPVYFVRGSEPYMSIAVPMERFAGNTIGALQAEVNLKYIGEVVSNIKVGKAGYAYLVTRSGGLVAHPDVSLVLQRRNVAQLEQVKAAFQANPNVGKPKAVVTRSLQGTKVFSSYALIRSLDWAVFIERPVAEAYEPLYASILRTSGVLLFGLGMALVVGLFVARRVVRPLQTLRQGVERIGDGDLSFRLELKTGDEIEVLAEEFNKMTRALQESYANLEQKVAARTQELRLANQRLDEASKHKSQFLANVSHELRTPLNAIIGFTRLVLRKTEGQIPELQRENLQKVLISAEHLLKLINGLLDLAKIEAGRMEVSVEQFRLDEVVETAVSTVEPMLEDGKVRLVTEIAADIPTLNTDRQKLEEILLNLLSNAAKFTEQGEVRLKAWREDQGLKLVVSDTGVGIKKEALGHIFEAFRQADVSGPGRSAGTGLGLAIVKRLVDLLGGNISVESEVGKGSKFTLSLPFVLGG